MNAMIKKWCTFPEEPTLTVAPQGEGKRQREKVREREIKSHKLISLKSFHPLQ